MAAIILSLNQVNFLQTKGLCSFTPDAEKTSKEKPLEEKVNLVVQEVFKAVKKNDPDGPFPFPDVPIKPTAIKVS